METRHLPPGPGTDARRRLVAAGLVRMYAIHRPSGENIGATSIAGVLRNTVGVPGVHPRDRVALHRQDHQIQAGDAGAIARERPGTCRWDATTRAAVWFGLSVSRVTSPVPSAFTQYRLTTPGFARSDANTMRRPSGVQTGNRSSAGVERQLRQRVARPVVHPDVALLAVGDVHRQLLAVGREPRIRPVGLRRAKRRRLAVARHPVDRVGHRRAPRRARTRACRREENASCAPPYGRVRGDALERRHGLADRLEAIEIEAHREERALLHVDQVPAFASLRRGKAARHVPAVVAAAHDDLRRARPRAARRRGWRRRSCSWTSARCRARPCRRAAPAATAASPRPRRACRTRPACRRRPRRA